MSSSLPPAGPPPGAVPPPPPQGPAEYLESGSGRPIPPPSDGGGGVRKGLYVLGGVVGLTAIGVGAWAAVSFLATGPQPAEALPDSTLAYFSVDLDPSGGQKIEALQTLNKFPAFEDEVGIDTDDDILKAIFEDVQGALDCEGLDYEDDVEPWLGQRAAVAAVDAGGEDPDPVFVVQVKDAEAADEGLATIQDCAGEDVAGWAVDGDWAVVAETDEIAETVAKDAAKASLADDEDFQKWTEEAGDPGIVTLYAAPSLGDYLAEHADSLFGFPLMGLAMTDCAVAEDLDGGSVDGCMDGYPEGDDGESPMNDELRTTLEDFAGMAAVLRFDDGAIELELAGAGDVVGGNLLASRSGGDTISSLPEDTAAAIGVGFSDGWFSDLLELYGPSFGAMGQDLDSLLEELEAETGLELPEDVETLLGDSAALALGADFDPEALVESADGSDVPVALKVDGEPEEIEAVLEKLRAQLPEDETLFLDSDADGGTIVIGPDAGFREEVLQDGGLGDTEVFEDVVREVDDASAVLFVNINELEDLVAETFGESDQQLVDNVEPLSGFGISGYVDDDVAHAVVRVTTD